MIRENGYDADGEMVLRIEVRTLISYTRLLTDNNNIPTHLDTPGFRYRDLSNNVLTMMQMYHENRNSSPCKLHLSSSYNHNRFLVIHAVDASFADDFCRFMTLYRNEGNIILPNIPNTLFKVESDFDFEQPDANDFYFSVSYMLQYQ